MVLSDSRSSKPVSPFTIVCGVVRVGVEYSGRRSGKYINFDLAWPSAGIPDDFFPSDEALYGESEYPNFLWVRSSRLVISRLHG